MAEVEVTLRKYKNRRLYEVPAARYRSTEQVRDRLLKGERVYTLEGDDVTLEVLVQLLTLDQRKGKRGLTADKLRAFICSYST